MYSKDLYTSYPFTYEFAQYVTLSPNYTSISNSLIELLMYYSTGTDEGFSGQTFIYLPCRSARFLINNGNLYYYILKSDIYFDLSQLQYEDVVISSIKYLVSQDILNKEVAPWLFISSFLLQSSSFFQQKLIFHLKEEKSVEDQKKSIIYGLIGNLERTSSFSNEKYSKNTILNILNFLEVDSNQAKLITKKYISVFTDPSILIVF